MTRRRLLFPNADRSRSEEMPLSLVDTVTQRMRTSDKGRAKWSNLAAEKATTTLDLRGLPGVVRWLDALLSHYHNLTSVIASFLPH